MIAFTILGLLVFWCACFCIGAAIGYAHDLYRGFDVMFGDYDKEVAEVVAFLTVLQKAGR